MRLVICSLVLITAGLGGLPHEDGLSSCRPGRQRFALEQIPMALGWHGVAAVLYFQPEKLPARAGLYLCGSALGYFGTLALSSRLPITAAQAHLSTAFGYRGILAGHSLDAWLKFRPWSNRILAMWFASVAGQVAGFVLARNTSSGRAAFVSASTDLGIIQGLCIGTIVNDLIFHDSLWHASPSVGILPGALVGTAAGLVLSRSRHCSEAQVMTARTFTLAGAILPGAAYYAVSGRTGRRDQSVIAGLASLGSIGGTLLGKHLTRTRILSDRQSFLVTGLGVGAGLAAAGLGYAGFRSTRVAAGLGAAGAAAGLAGSWLMVSSSGTQPTTLSRRVAISLDALAIMYAGISTRTDFSARNLVSIRL
ncbi:MAG: hypothetical protein ABIK86_04160 [candidate division WOR-3 bacterium]